MIFIKTLQKMLKQGLTLIDAMKDELGRKNMKGFVELIVKT